MCSVKKEDRDGFGNPFLRENLTGYFHQEDVRSWERLITHALFLIYNLTKSVGH